MDMLTRPANVVTTAAHDTALARCSVVTCQHVATRRLGDFPVCATWPACRDAAE